MDLPGLAPPVTAAAGQASIEYVAAVTLVSVVLGAAATAVGAPAVAKGVVHGVRTGLCIVGGDVCRPSDAEAAGLEPCTMATAVRGRDSRFDFGFVSFGSRGEWTASRDSDGRVTLAHAQGGSLGLRAGIGLSAGSFDVSGEVGASARLIPVTAWEFPDAAAARRFLALPQRARERYPVAWRTIEGGSEARAAAEAMLGGQLIAGVEGSAELSDGVRIGGDGMLTIYLRTRLAGPFPAGGLVFGAGRGATELMAEYTLVHGKPRELAFRRLEPGSGGARLTETVGRLDLRDPANWAAAKPLIETDLPWPPTGARQVRDLLRRIARVGTIERATFAVNDRSTTGGASVKLGAELGLRVRTTDVDERLISATARTQGSPERRRLDCADEET
jgi:hypothetical protein